VARPAIQADDPTELGKLNGRYSLSAHLPHFSRQLRIEPTAAAKIRTCRRFYPLFFRAGDELQIALIYHSRKTNRHFVRPGLTLRFFVLLSRAASRPLPVDLISISGQSDCYKKEKNAKYAGRRRKNKTRVHLAAQLLRNATSRILPLTESILYL
jgi:hypothetical protein